ncbi:MAG: glycosyltransferase [Anaerolineae bacterium]|nr:glycosyltransferase [Anaerolineae bacterium]
MGSVLLVSPMRLDRQRAGPANRYWEFACALSREHRVTLLVQNEDHPQHSEFAVCTASECALPDLVARHEVIVVQGPAIQEHPELIELAGDERHYWVADLYDPITLELLPVQPGSEVGAWLHLANWAVLAEQLKRADFFVCASERQRLYWLGALGALGRLHHDTWDGADFRRLIDVVPFGVPPHPPQAAAPVLRGVVPGIEAGDRVLVWGGGIWDWLDPLTPVRALPAVIARHPAARLIFFTSPHWRTSMIDRARQLATDLGLIDSHVLFVPWVTPEEWPGVLLEADVGLSFHPSGLETYLAFRTRLLDYVWAGLPIVTASGDVLSDLVAENDLGHVVPPGDVEGLASALSSLLAEPDARARRQESFGCVAEGLAWDKAVGPLLSYCRAPWRAGDKGESRVRHWQMAGRERLLSDLAHAELDRCRLDGIVATLDHERACAVEYAQELERAVSRLEGEREELTRQVGALRQCLEESERRLEAAMNGRVMRLMTRLQRAVRRAKQ